MVVFSAAILQWAWFQQCLQSLDSTFISCWQLRRTIRKKHTLPNYKMRFKPVFPRPEMAVSPCRLQVNGQSITVGRLCVTFIKCSRLPSLSKDTTLYCILSAGAPQLMVNSQGWGLSVVLLISAGVCFTYHMLSSPVCAADDFSHNVKMHLNMHKVMQCFKFICCCYMWRDAKIPKLLIGRDDSYPSVVEDHLDFITYVHTIDLNGWTLKCHTHWLDRVMVFLQLR